MYDPRKKRFPLFALVACLFVVLLCNCPAMFAADEVFAAEVNRAAFEDGDKPYLTVFGDVPFNVAELREMHPNAHFRHVKTKTDPIAARYAATVGEWPAVVYQEPNGTVIFKASGKNVPTSAVEVAKVGGRCRPFRPEPEPTPAPVAPIAPPVIEPPVPDTVVPDTEPEAPTWIYFAVFGVAAMISAGIAWLREIRGE